MNKYKKNYLNHVKSSIKSKHEMAFLFLCREAKLPNPVREFRFHPSRKWRLDFAWPQYKIGIEIEGGLWRKDKKGNWAGAHSHPTNIVRDIEKGNALTIEGWRLLRFTDKEIKSGEAIRLTQKLLTMEVNKNENKKLSNGAYFGSYNGVGAIDISPSG